MTHAQTAAVPASSPERLRAAFDELHGSRLHGFALLLTLGDRAGAARLAGEALAAAEPRIDALRHPERAAAWLRAHVVRSEHGPGRRGVDVPGRQHALSRLGTDHPTYAGLAALRQRERAALIATDVEGLDRRDVETIVDLRGSALDRLLVRARLTYLDAQAAAAGEPSPGGPLVERLHELASRAMR